jgi:hypothetical protein
MIRKSALFTCCALLIALGMGALMLTPVHTRAAQVSPTSTDFFGALTLPAFGGARATRPAYIGAPQYPLAVLPDGTAIPSLTGVGGRAERGAVAIRSGPGINFPRIGRVAPDAWIHIVGWNGWSLDRGCTPDFAADLDMWVQVQTHTGEVRGWSARCALSILGDVTALPIVNAAGERIFQR